VHEQTGRISPHNPEIAEVKIKLNAGDLPAAGKVYQKLKKLAPQSEEVIEARELIKAAVIKKGK
jgi:hypothetical protein